MIKKNLPLLSLFFLYASLFFNQIFIGNYNLNFATAFEVDPGSIMDSIYKMYNFPIYSHFNGFHSKFYGWAYNSICFFLTIPLMIIGSIYTFDLENAFIIEIRIIHFLIGFLMISFFYLFLNEYFKNRFFPLILCVAIIFASGNEFFYFIHPETIGVLFLILAAWCFKKCLSIYSIKFFYLSLIFLTLAALSKQIFAIYCLICFIYFFLYYFKDLKGKYSKNRSNFNFIFRVFLIALITSILVMPYAFISPLKFISYQIELSTTFYENTSFFDSIFSWSSAIKQNFFLTSNLLLNMFFMIYVLIRQKKAPTHYWFFNFSIFFYFITIASVNKNNPQLVYLYLVNFLLLFNYIFLNYIKVKDYFYTIFIISILLTNFYNIYNEYPELKSKLERRLDKKNSLVYLSYNFINNIQNDKLVIFHDQHVAVPSQHTSCHFWKECNDMDYVSTINPDYIIYAENYKIDWAGYNVKPDRIKEYINSSNQYELETIISANTFNFHDFSNNLDSTGLYVYKKK